MTTREFKSLLRRRGLSQVELARAAGIHPSTVSRAVNGLALGEDAERRVLEILDPATVTNTPIQVQVSADA